MITKQPPRAEARYAAYVYHDEPGEANVDNLLIGYFPSVLEARRAINGSQSDYWQVGSIHYGFLTPAILGVRPQSFEMDEREVPWYVGSDGKARR